MKLNLIRISLMGMVFFLTAANLQAQKKTVQKAVQKPVAKKPDNAAPVAKAGLFANGIKLNVKGFIVKDAYLVFEDETKVPAGNMVDLSQRVSLRIILDNNFKEVNGKVYPGGSEKIVLSTGAVILESDDLFTTYDAVGVDPAEAKYISLKAVITEIKDKKNAVIVSFKVWDKKSSDNLITGSYVMHIK